ncbi:TraR/DksA family transcriptional regulator [Marinicella sp. W31]|uniref:TraR/DksA family transcriptional regulator n=1 Tax=Marinicella sp. W31 TaxID=3023713 RepID=UPI0037580B95
MQTIKQYQQILLEEQKRLEDLMEKTQAHLRHVNGPVSQDFADQATETENDEVVAALNHEAQHELKLIKFALRRIENQVFGICVECGERIQEKRLQALPHTPLCIHCAEA